VDNFQKAGDRKTAKQPQKPKSRTGQWRSKLVKAIVGFATAESKILF
jgi:hypothetical protein